MKHAARLMMVLVTLTCVLAWAAPASAMYHPSLGRWLQRDPVGHVDGPNVYEYVAGSPADAQDPSGLWKNYDSRKPYLWCADNPNDTLQSLAARKYGTVDSWVCLWPEGDTQDHGYSTGRVAVGDKYSAKNLERSSCTGGTNVEVNLDMLGAFGQSYQLNRPMAVQVATGDRLYELLKRKSKEGLTPIRRFEFAGHAQEWPRLVPSDEARLLMKRLGRRSVHFSPRGYSPDEPAPTFQRAKEGKGPHRCWFTRNAEGRVIACDASTFARAFADTFLREGASIQSLPYGWGAHTVPSGRSWGVDTGAGTPTDWSGNFKAFLAGSYWLTIMGRL